MYLNREYTTDDERSTMLAVVDALEVALKRKMNITTLDHKHLGMVSYFGNQSEIFLVREKLQQLKLMEEPKPPTDIPAPSVFK